jgi:anti-sigma factor RsiW
MILNCKEVWRAISDYIDDDIDARLKEDLESHLATCRHCAALVDSLHNVLVLVADERTFTLPFGFSQRLRDRLRVEIESSRK